MNILLKKLRIVGSASTHSWTVYSYFRDLFFAGTLQLQDISVAPKYCVILTKNYLQNRNAWMTFDQCVYIRVEYIDDTLLLHIRAWEGDSFTGNPTSSLWQADFTGILPEHLNILKHAIEAAFDKYTENIYEAEEEQKRVDRLKHISKQLLATKKG